MVHPPGILNSEPICQLSDGIAIRPYRYSDIQSTSRHANNKNITKYMRDRFPSPYTEADAKTWFDMCYSPENLVRCGPWTLETGSQGPAVIPTSFAITVNDEAVGSIGVDFGKDVYFRTAELGYWLGEEHWNKGVMSKVVPAFVEWVWRTFGILVRLNAGTYERNFGSQNVLKKAGFVFEGRRQNSAFKNGELVTELMWGALRPT